MSKNSIRVLLVDDDAEYVSMVKHYLRSFQNNDFELVWEGNPANLPDRLTANPPFDVILMDYAIPQHDGMEVVRKIHDMKAPAPVILLTEGKDFRLAIEAMKYGVEEYLVKDETTD